MMERGGMELLLAALVACHLSLPFDGFPENGFLCSALAKQRCASQ
jgi:hypothetical protein